jgi:hypothetical protein
VTRLFPHRLLSPDSASRFALLRWQDIVVDGELYLRKFYLWRTPWCQATLHWIRQPDPGRDHHDHPRDFVSLVLRGGYVEERLAPSRHWTHRLARLRGSLCYRRAEAAHRVVHVSPDTLTLVLWGRQRRGWGFWTRGGWVDWRTYCGVEPRYSRGIQRLRSPVGCFLMRIFP